MRFILIALTVLSFYAHAFASDFPAKEVYSRFSPSVVVIKASKEGGSGMIGAGSIISDKGLIITNAHVFVSKDDNLPYPKLRVYIRPDKLTGSAQEDLSNYFDAEVLRYSRELDLALIKIKDFNLKSEIIEFADPSDIRVGEEVVAIGHPEQGGFWSLTYGRISGEIKDYQGVPGKDVYQTDTSVNRGNSGGPLLDRRGYMVAINSNIARLGRDGLPITGVNFSIKSSVVKKWLNENEYTIAYGKKPLDEEGKKIEVIEASKKPDTQKGEDRFNTPARPYDYNEFLKAAEKDIEGMMEEMKGKTRRK
jgi:serine protease Do